ncbi:MAG: toxin HicA [Mailhella sp.]|nr:toxin HicA [Mailhella sp.]
MSLKKILEMMRTSPQNVRFADLDIVCRHYFGEPRQSGTSHRIYKTPWKGDPRINIQNDKGKAKRYQVLTVLEDIEKLSTIKEGENDEL